MSTPDRSTRSGYIHRQPGNPWIVLEAAGLPDVLEQLANVETQGYRVHAVAPAQSTERSSTTGGFGDHRFWVIVARRDDTDRSL